MSALSLSSRPADFSQQDILIRWLRDPDVDPLKKVDVVLHLDTHPPRSPRIEERLIAWLRDSEIPLLTRIAAVVACLLPLVVLAVISEPLGPVCLGILGGIALFGPLVFHADSQLNLSPAQLRELRQASLLSFQQIADAIGGLEAYYKLPVLKAPYAYSLCRTDPPPPVAKGKPLLPGDWHALFLHLEDISTKQRFGLMFYQRDRSSEWGFKLRCELEGYAQAWEEYRAVKKAPIPTEDKDRYIEEIHFPPAEDPELLAVLNETFPWDANDGSPAGSKMCAAIHQIVVEKNHPRFQLVEAR